MLLLCGFSCFLRGLCGRTFGREERLFRFWSSLPIFTRDLILAPGDYIWWLPATTCGRFYLGRFKLALDMPPEIFNYDNDNDLGISYHSERYLHVRILCKGVSTSRDDQMQQRFDGEREVCASAYCTTFVTPKKRTRSPKWRSSKDNKEGVFG